MPKKSKHERRKRDQFRRNRATTTPRPTLEAAGDQPCFLPIRASGEGQAEETDGKGGRRRFQLHCVLGTGWVHTHGMAERGCPEVEVRHVPDFLAEPAADLIRRVCNYMLDTGNRIRPGEVMETSPRSRIQFVKPEPVPGNEDHYSVERLQIIDVERTCECCDLAPSGSE